MTAKQKKLFLLTSMMSVFVMAVTVLFTSGQITPFRVSSLNRSSAPTANSLTISKAAGATITTVSNDYYYASGHTAGGGSIYLFNASNVSLGTSYVAKMCGTWDKGSIEPVMTFTPSIQGKTPSLYQFQYIDSITMVSDSANTRTLTVHTSENGTDFSDFGSLAVTSSGATINMDGARYVKFTYSGSYTVSIVSVVVNYHCSTDGDGWLYKEVVSLDVSNPTTEFEQGDSFACGGTVTATYDDGSTEDVTSNATYTGFDLETIGEQTVTVSYGGVSASYGIEVVAGVLDSISLAGQTTEYSKNSVFSFDGTVTASYVNGFEKVVSPTSVTSPDMTTTGEKSVTVTYTEGGVTRTASYTITVTDVASNVVSFSKSNGTASTFTISGNTYEYVHTTLGTKTYGAIVNKFTADSQDSEAVLAMKGTAQRIIFTEGSVNTSDMSKNIDAKFTSLIKTVKVTMKYTYTSSASVSLKVYYSTDGSTWSDSLYRSISVSTTYSELSIDLSSYNAKSIRLGINHGFSVSHFKEINIETN